MTSEIVVMNKFGLAIAADSAVTVDQFDNGEIVTKTYNSANKLFSLSKFAPVALMFYNTVNLGGVPWETIIKSYRSNLGRKTFPKLKDYADDFFDYLKTNKNLFPQKRLKKIAGINVYRELLEIKKQTKNKASFIVALRKRIDALEKKERIDTFTPDFEKHLGDEYYADIEQFLDIAIPKSYKIGNIRLFKQFVELIFSQKELLQGYSGIVVAGFGEDEYLPIMQHYVCDCIINSCVRHWKIEEVEISYENPGKVVPLADSQITETIISGINPVFKNKSSVEAYKVLFGIPDIIISNLPGLNSASQQLLRNAINKPVRDSYVKFVEEIEKIRKEEYEDPIHRTISSLPLAELGQVAETFINASQIHKRVNPGFETVGGPVDVAIISKGDGMVWVNRKHYFDAELNPVFKLRYLDS